MNVRRRRLIGAFAIVVCAVLVAPAMSLAIEKGASAKAAVRTAADNNADQDAMPGLSDDWKKDPLAALDRIEADVAAAGQPPDAFLAEAGFPAGAYEVRANAYGNVVGCVVDADEDTSFDAVCEVLEAKGWRGVSLSGVTGATFVKQSGSLRWMLVTCTQAGEATCIVYRLGQTETQSAGPNGTQCVFTPGVKTH